MVRIVFTSNLQRHLSVPDRQVSATTVRAALQQVFEGQPQLRGYLLDDQGELRKHVFIFVDGERIQDRVRLSDPVREASEIYVMQALTGG